MAIDSEVKRKSVAAVAAVWMGAVVVPDSSIDQADRQAIGWSYAGIAAQSPIVIALVPPFEARGSDGIVEAQGDDGMIEATGSDGITEAQA